MNTLVVGSYDHQMTFCIFVPIVTGKRRKQKNEGRAEKEK